jgi:hypothetical protein
MPSCQFWCRAFKNSSVDCSIVLNGQPGSAVVCLSGAVGNYFRNEGQSQQLHFVIYCCSEVLKAVGTLLCINSGATPADVPKIIYWESPA